MDVASKVKRRLCNTAKAIKTNPALHQVITAFMRLPEIRWRWPSANFPDRFVACMSLAMARRSWYMNLNLSFCFPALSVRRWAHREFNLNAKRHEKCRLFAPRAAMLGPPTWWLRWGRRHMGRAVASESFSLHLMRMDCHFLSGHFWGYSPSFFSHPSVSNCSSASRTNDVVTLNTNSRCFWHWWPFIVLFLKKLLFELMNCFVLLYYCRWNIYNGITVLARI